MRLSKCEDENDWYIAENILLEVVEWLEENGCALWSKEQVSVNSLKKCYSSNELYFVEENEEIIGLVFLQKSDKLFWPEIKNESTFYVHKLGLRKHYKSKGYGKKVMQLIVEKARSLGVEYVRLDCVVRNVLLEFYIGCGFKLVDYKNIKGFRVARFEYKC